MYGLKVKFKMLQKGRKHNWSLYAYVASNGLIVFKEVRLHRLPLDAVVSRLDDEVWDGL